MSWGPGIKWDGTINKERILTHAKTSWPNFFKALLLGLIAVGTVYVMTYAAEVFWGLSPRIWKVQINVLNNTRWGLFLTYFPLYLLFFGVFNFSQTIGLKIKGQSEAGFIRLIWLASTAPGVPCGTPGATCVCRASCRTSPLPSFWGKELNFSHFCDTLLLK